MKFIISLNFINFSIAKRDNRDTMQNVHRKVIYFYKQINRSTKQVALSLLSIWYAYKITSIRLTHFVP